MYGVQNVKGPINCFTESVGRFPEEAMFYRGNDFYDWFLNKRLNNTVTIVKNKDGKICSTINKILIIHPKNKTRFSVLFDYQSEPKEAGAGFYILRSIAKNPDGFVVPGVVGSLSSTYKALKAKKLELFWGRKLVLLGLVKGLTMLIKKEFSIGRLEDSSRKYFITNVICDNLIEDLVEKTDGLVEKSYFSWRLASLKSERLFVCLEKNSNSFVIAAAGLRKKVPVMRIFMCFGDEKSVSVLCKIVESTASKIGCIFLLVTCDKRYQKILTHNNKIKNIKNSPETLIKGVEANEFKSVIGLYSDIGINEQWSSI
jgi:hypothetical protein